MAKQSFKPLQLKIVQDLSANNYTMYYVKNKKENILYNMSSYLNSLSIWWGVDEKIILSYYLSVSQTRSFQENITYTYFPDYAEKTLSKAIKGIKNSYKPLF